MLSSCVLTGIYCAVSWCSKYLFCRFDDMDLSIGVDLRGPQTLNIPNCGPGPKSV